MWVRIHMVIVDWFGLGQSAIVDWVGLDLAKWTQVQLCLGCLTNFDTWYTNRRVFTQGSAFWGLEHSIFISSLSKHPKTHFGLHILESLWQTHIRITPRSTELRCWNLVNYMILPSTLGTHESFSVGMHQGVSSSVLLSPWRMFRVSIGLNITPWIWNLG